MIWPPIKAWTCKSGINGHVHFVAINYGSELLNKWVILMSVIDSRIVIKISWSELKSSSNWGSGWDNLEIPESSKLKNNINFETTDLNYASDDSGLTIPINKNNIRPWFE